MPTTLNESLRHVVIAENELLEIPLATYRCELCGFSVKTKANLRAHHIKTHKILQTDADWAFFWKRKRQFTYVYHCPVVPCKHNIGFNYGFSSTSRLKQHYQLVHMKRSYKCDRCGGLFATPSSQAYHMRFCGTVFACPVCSRRYSFKKHLDQHFRRSGHRPNGKIVPRSNHVVNHCNPQPDRRNTNINRNIVPTNAVSASIASPPQPVVVPLVLLPVGVCGSGGTDKVISACGTNWSGNVTLMPLVASNGLPANLLQSMLMGSTVAATGLQSGSLALVPMAQKHHTPSLIAASSQSVVDASTQTQIGTPLTTDPLAVSSVSVNTCTDEDDIRSFIGSLFCDAGVETNFPFTELDMKDCEDQDCQDSVEKSNEDVNPSNQITQISDFISLPVHDTVAATPEPQPSMAAKAHDPTKPRLHPSPELFPFDLVDEEIPTGLRHSIEHTSMQTDVVADTNADPATRDFPFQFPEARLLETPPPLSSTSISIFPYSKQPLVSDSKNESVNPTDSGLLAINTFLRGPILPHSSSCSSSNPDNSDQIPVLTGQPSSFEPSTDLNGSSSHSVGLQAACHWSADRAYSSIASQTLSDDWDSWFHSVHTQTAAIVCPGLQSFSDMCVGVDDMFSDEQLNSLELTTPNPQSLDVSFGGIGDDWSLTQTDKQTDRPTN